MYTPIPVGMLYILHLKYKTCGKGVFIMGRKVLLGFTADNSVIFAEVSFRNGVFTASFDESYPVEVTKDLIIESIKSCIDGMDKGQYVSELEEFDCKPSELAEELYNTSYDPVDEYLDISLYPESFRIPNHKDDIYFMASGCGQHDTRGMLVHYVNKELYDYIHELWDEYHLKPMPKDLWDKLDSLINAQGNEITEYRYVEDYLSQNFK